MDKFTLCLSVNPEAVAGSAEPPWRLRLALLLMAAAHLTIVPIVSTCL